MEADGWDQDDSVDGNSLLEQETCRPKNTAGNVKISEELPNKERRKARAVNEEFINVFTDLPGSNDLSVHRIQLTSNHPVKSKPYAIPFHIKSELENDIRDAENEYHSGIGVVIRISSRFSSETGRNKPALHGLQKTQSPDHMRLRAYDTFSECSSRSFPRPILYKERIV